MKSSMAVPVRGRSSGSSKQARVNFSKKLQSEGSESGRTAAVHKKVEERSLRPGATRLRPDSNLKVPASSRALVASKGTSSQRPATKGSKSSKGTKPYKGARPSKILDEQSIVNKRLKGASTSRCLQNRNLYQPGAYNAGYESESDNEDEYESSATNAAGNFTIPAGHYTLAQALEGQAAQVLGEALSRAASMVLEGEGMGEEGVMVEVGVGAASGATPKLSDAESGWSSSNGSRRSSVAGMLESVSQRALHVVTHTVPKKARRLTEAMVGLGDDLSQAADAAADRLRASSVKFATKVEKTFDRAQAKVEKAGGKIKGWCKQVGTGFKSLLVCGASNLPVA